MIIANDEEESEGNTNGDADLTDSDSDGEGNKKWSDRALMNKYGKITAIEVGESRIKSIELTNIHRIRARCLHSPFPPIPPSRYGREEEGWSQWRRTAKQLGTRTPEHRVELGANIHLEGGYSGDFDGYLRSLAVTNLDDGTRQVFGAHWKDDDDYSSLRELPPVVQSKLALTHLYGEEKYGDYSLCFNYE